MPDAHSKGSFAIYNILGAFSGVLFDVAHHVFALSDGKNACKVLYNCATTWNGDVECEDQNGYEMCANSVVSDHELTFASVGCAALIGAAAVSTSLLVHGLYKRRCANREAQADQDLENQPLQQHPNRAIRPA